MNAVAPTLVQFTAAAVAADKAQALQRVLAVARSHAEDVDRNGRFPAETVAALRVEGLLAALVPAAAGGDGQSVRAAALACYALGGCCASSAMILAMHHSQVACLADHAGGIAWLEALLGRVGRDGLLLASVTSEVGVGGKMRSSRCAVEPAGEPAGDGRFTLEKRASSISYGAYADVLLVTARAAPSAGESDQVLVVVPATPEVLSRTGGWNSMGMRGTCSEAFVVRASGGMEQIIPVPFARIAAETMVPISHLLWSSAWCGIAADAVARARAFLRAKIRAGGSPSADGANHLVRATERLLAVEALVKQALSGHDSVGPGTSFAAAASLNMLKTGVSDACLAIVEEALLVCGFAGYANEGPYSLSRHVRDIHSARLMIHNDRVRDNTAHLLMLQAPALGLC